ncbi:MAG: hypothetical protein LLF90_03520 [Methanomicrobiaceae archaeon]|nr:hypothetical protein [Methanomicrobiaceae archaeon]
MSTVAGHYTPPPGDLLTGLYGAFFEPARAGSAAFFQVSPLSFFALLRRRPTGISARDARLLAFFALAAALVVLAYTRSLPGMSASPGIVPDMRYLSPAYLPLLVMGVYALKHAGLDGDGGEALRTLFWLAVVDLPPPPRLHGPGADALLARLARGRRLPVRHQLLGGLPPLDTRGGVRLVHPVHDLPALRGRETPTVWQLQAATGLPCRGSWRSARRPASPARWSPGGADGYAVWRREQCFTSDVEVRRVRDGEPLSGWMRTRR